jgi:hypothetical protein
MAQERSENGIGLGNISKRYALLSNKSPNIVKTASEFIVTLPLLHLNGNTDH